MSRPIVGFFHIALINQHQDITEEILSLCIDSGLMEVMDQLNLCILGEEEFVWPVEHPRFNIAYRSPNIKEYEYATLKVLANYARDNPTAKLMHIHNSGTKNGRKSDGNYGDPKYPYWRYLEAYHTISRHKECIDYLDCFDGCGIEYITDPGPHFSGTWWWANANYINTLPPISEIEGDHPKNALAAAFAPMHGAEFWIGMNPNHNFKSLYNTGYHWVRRHESMEVVKRHLDNLPVEEQYWLKYQNA